MHEKLETRTFLLFLLLVTLGFLLMLKPFFGPIFWACAIAIVFSPVQARLLKRWPSSPNVAALLTLLLCIVVLILPVVFIFSSVVDEGVLVYNKLLSGEISPAHYLELVHKAFPQLEHSLEKLGIDVSHIKSDVVNGAMEGGKYLASHTFTIGQNAFGFVVSLVLMLYVTFFMLRDGDKLIELIVRALPLGDTRERMLFALFAEVTRATIKGNIVIAMIQGSLGGITLACLGVPGAILLGVFMCFASLVPAVGSALIWVPIAIYLAAIGQTTSAIILVGVGAGVIGTIDSVLRPMLVGRDTKLPDYLVLLSTLGGIGLFGINGFVIGPLMAALFIAFWGIFIREVHVLAPDQPEEAATDTPAISDDAPYSGA